MVKFRMSMKSDKADVKAHHISIPAKDAIAIVPPKKVIKALYDWAPEDPTQAQYLAFSQGDFLHVVGREHDLDWYEACNPLQGSRGLVPAKYFDTVGKTVRDSGDSTRSDSLSVAPHDSGYAGSTATMSPESNGGDVGMKSVRLSKQLKGTGAMVYGIVMYDFKAERPDELEAKEGEAIIVIAQSNPEWFVAKPITRLGGPGLIPVSFIEIRDMVTGKAVPDAHEAVQRAGVPKVEEWKKMAADYKNGSIPLGKLDSGPQGMQQGMARMSLGNQTQNNYDQNGYGHANHQRTNSGYQQQGQTAQKSPQLLAPVKACVPRYCFADETFWFIVECQMEDGRHWELSRLYQDFYDLQINLIQEYPLEAGNVKGVDRSLPYMPGPVGYVTDNISNGRRQNLDEYIRNLLKLGQHITKGYLVRKFFAPREDDYEIDPSVSAEDGYRLSSASQHSGSDPSRGASRQSSGGNLNGQPTVVPPNQSAWQQRQPGAIQQPGPAQGQGHYRSTSNLDAPSMNRQISAQTQSSANSNGTPAPAPAPAAPVAALKIKVWFEADNCVVIRMPPAFRFADLYKKLRERRALEKIEGEEGGLVELGIEYRDEQEGRLFPIENDEDLDVARERNPKLTLNVSAAR